MLIIEPKIGLVIGKASNPTYSFTLTRVDTKTKRFFGDIKDDGFTYHDSYFDQIKSDGTYELPDPFILLADPEPSQDKTMTQPTAVLTPTPWTCYNCGKNCFDKAGRSLLSENDTRTAWCGECATECAKRARIFNKGEIPVLLEKNGMCLVGLSDAEKASPTLKNNSKIKVEKGQVWRRTPSSELATINDVKDGYASIGLNKQWGKLTPEGYPDTGRWDLKWRLIQPAPIPQAEVGQTYTRDDGWTIKITKITDSSVAATQIGTFSDYKDGFHHPYFTSLEAGKMNQRWKLVEEKPAEPTKIKMKVGQVWKCGSTSCRITQIRKDNSVDVIRTGNGKDEVINNYGSIHADGTSGFGKSWVLEQDIDYTKTKVEAGQTWTNSTGAVEVKIVGIGDGYALNQHSNAWGRLTPEGYPDGWVNLPHGWYLSKIEPAQNPLPANPPIPPMKVGQVWAFGKMGEEHKIVGFKNNKVNILIGASRKVGEGFGTVKPDGSPGEDWGKIQEDRWHLVREEPIKVKVGQKWRWIGSHEPTLLNQVFTVEELKTTGECKVDSARVAIHRNVSDDTVMNPVFANWELVEEAPASQPKAKPIIGSVWKDRNGKAFRIVAFKEKSKDRYYVELEKRREDGSWASPYAWDWREGKFELDSGKEWTLDLPEVGSIWKRESDGSLFRVQAVDPKREASEFIDVRLEKKSSGSSTWTSGYAWNWKNGAFTQDFGKDWTLQPKETKAVPVPGQIWKVGSKRYRVVSFDPINDNVVLAYLRSDGIIENGHNWGWFDGKFEKLGGSEWSLEETTTNEIAAQPPIGSIWKVGEQRYRVAKFLGGSGRNVELEFFANDRWNVGSRWSWENGKFTQLYGKEWTLEEQKKPYHEPKVGQVWKVGSQKYTVKEIRKPSNSAWDKDVVFKDVNGVVVAWDWKDGKFNSGYTWELLTDVPAGLPEVKVGQIWDPGDGTKYRITKIENGLGYFDKEFNGKYVYGGGWYLTNGKWDKERPLIPGKNWNLISENETIPPPPVGSIWSPDGGGALYRVAEIRTPRNKGEEALVVMDLKRFDGSWEHRNNEWGWKDGKLISSLDWKQVGQAENKTEEAVEKPAVKIGQVYRLNSQKYRVRSLEGEPTHTARLDRWQADKNAWVAGSDWNGVKEGILGGANWILEEDVKQMELKIGQVWSINGVKYRIHSFEGSPPTRVRLDSWQGNNTFLINQTSHPIKDGVLGEVNPWKWVLEEDVAPEKTVSEKPTFRQMMGADMVNATYRVAAHQLTKASKQALLSLMEKQGHNSQSIKALSELLDTEFGSALVGMTLGMGLTYIPQVSNSGRARRLATEFRTGSMATAGNVVADAMTEHFIPAITNALSGLPKEQIRVSTSLPAPEEQVEPHEEIEKEARA